MSLLEGKVAIVTGGARGIGEAIVRGLAAQGASVAFTYVSEGSAARAQALADELGDRVRAYQSDAGQFDQAAELINKVVADWGHLDILINNAGITKDTLMLRMTEQQWDDVIQTNLKSVFNMTKHALKHLMKNKTVIVIAHRLSTIMQMDRIVVLENGVIIEDGKHAELIKVKQGVYQKLWGIQAGSFV